MTQAKTTKTKTKTKTEARVTAKHIGLAVRAIRKRRGLTQSELAVRMGCEPDSRSFVTRIETKGQVLNLDTSLRLADALGCSLWRIYLLAERIAERSNSKEEYEISSSTTDSSLSSSDLSPSSEPDSPGPAASRTHAN